jgi:hypothetical protein
VVTFQRKVTARRAATKANTELEKEKDGVKGMFVMGIRKKFLSGLFL